MKIAVIGSTGRAGSRIVSEAKGRHHQVVGIARNERQGLQKDLFELTTEDLKTFDVVISAFGTWDDQGLHLKVAQHLDTIMSPLSSRWIIVGGAGSLFVSETIDLRLMDTAEFPESYRAVARGMAQGLFYLEQHGSSNWSYFSPPAAFEPGVKSGLYTLGQDHLLVDHEGVSAISMEDYAQAMIDVLESGVYNKMRFTAVRKLL